MPYIGRPIGVAGHTTQKLDDPASISSNAFTMKVATVAISPDAASLQIYVDGVRQEAGVAYTVSGSTITFTGTFTSSNDFQGYVMGDAMYIQTNSVDSDHYVDGSIDNAHLADNSVDSDQYVDGSIDNAHLADDAVNSDELAAGAVDLAHMSVNSIDSDQYVDGSIDTAHIADNQITLAKMAGGTDGNIISYDESGDPVAIATGSDGQVLTSTGAGSPPAFEAVTAAPVTALNNATANELVSVGSTTTELDAEANLTYDGEALLTATSSTASEPVFHIKNTAVDATSAELKFDNPRGGGAASAYDDLGRITFYGQDDASGSSQYGEVLVEASGVGNGSEEGKMSFYVASPSMARGLLLQGSGTSAEVDVTLGGGAASNTTVSGALNVTGDIDMADDKGVKFGSDDDLFMGSDGSNTLTIVKNTTIAVPSTGGAVRILAGGAADNSSLHLTSGESKGSFLRLNQDEDGEAADRWLFGQHATDGNDNQTLFMTDYSNGSSWDNEFSFSIQGAAQADDSWGTAGADYAEFFEWKTKLADEDACKAAYGMTVVLDGDKVRLAESGEESDVIGIVKSKNGSAIVGNTAGLKWKNKYLKNVWGEPEMEQYTQLKWYDMNDDGTKGSLYNPTSENIPQYKLKPENDLNQSRPDWHTLEENFIKDDDGNFIPLVVPSTEAEKEASEYEEWDKYKKDKAGHKKGDPLMRKKMNPDFDPDMEYKSRAERRDDWCIVGLLGQVPVRDTAVIPDHWKKMKNLESGIDMYYIK